MRERDKLQRWCLTKAEPRDPANNAHPVCIHHCAQQCAHAMPSMRSHPVFKHTVCSDCERARPITVHLQCARRIPNAQRRCALTAPIQRTSSPISRAKRPAHTLSMRPCNALYQRTKLRSATSKSTRMHCAGRCAPIAERRACYAPIQSAQYCNACSCTLRVPMHTNQGARAQFNVCPCTLNDTPYPMCGHAHLNSCHHRKCVPMHTYNNAIANRCAHAHLTIAMHT